MFKDILQDPLHNDLVHQEVSSERCLHKLKGGSGGCSLEQSVLDLLWQRVVLVSAGCVDMSPSIHLCHMEDLGELLYDRFGNRHIESWDKSH